MRNFLTRFLPRYWSGIRLPKTSSENTISCKRRIHRGQRARHWRGATTVEMALVAPFVILLVFGSIEFTRMMMLKQSLTNAAREGCRFAALGTTQNHSTAEDYARDRLRGVVKGYTDNELLEISVEPAFHSSPESGSLITTSIMVDCADVSWLPPMFFAGAEIRASASMRRE